MANNTTKPDQAATGRQQRVDAVVLPDVATPSHPIIDILPDVPVDNDLESAVDLPTETAEDAPVGDYVRQIQLEFDEQQEEGKV